MPVRTVLTPYTMHINQSTYASTFKDGSVTVMWSISSMTATAPNHFALLAPCQSYTTTHPASLQSVADTAALEASSCDRTFEADNPDPDDITSPIKVTSQQSRMNVMHD